MEQYFGVRTAEGGGVIHLIYCGVGVKRSELSKKWKDITEGSWNVHISKVVDEEKVLREMAFQHDKQRYFHSHRWGMTDSSVQKTLIKVKKIKYEGNLHGFKRFKSLDYDEDIPIDAAW